MTNKQKKEPKLSEAFAELEKITNEFENGEVDLEEGIPKFKKGLELAKYLKRKLTDIENEIKKIKIEFRDLEETPDEEDEKEEEIPF